MACGGPEDEYGRDLSRSEYYDAISERHGLQSLMGRNVHKDAPTPDDPYFLYYVLNRKWNTFITFSQVIGGKGNNAEFMVKWIMDHAADVINYKFSEYTLKNLCQNYAPRKLIQELNDYNWNIGHMFSVIDILLRKCGKVARTCNHTEIKRPRHLSHFRNISIPVIEKAEVKRKIRQQTSKRSTDESTPRSFSKSFGRISRQSPLPPVAEQRFDETLFATPTAFNKTIILSSPKREEPLLVNFTVDPKPLIETERGERFVCDVAINVQPGVSGMLPQTPQAIEDAVPRQLDTPPTTSRGRMPEMCDTPVANRGRLQRQHNVTSTSSGLFTPTVHKSIRRERIPLSEASQSLYDPSIVNEANILEDGDRSSRRITRSPRYVRTTFQRQANVLSTPPTPIKKTF